MSSPCVTVVVPTYERPEQLGRCLGALARQTLGRDAFQVVVVDDGSSCDLEAVVGSYDSRLRLDLLRQDHQGPAAARNRGVAVADGEFIAFTDDDCVPQPNWLERLRARLVAEGEACLVGGRIVNLLPNNPFSEASQLILVLVYEHFNSDPENAHFFASMNVGLSKDALLACGGFRPDFRTAEDRELCDRWRSNGHRLVYEPGAGIGHAHDLDLRSFCRQHFGYGRGAARYHQVRGEGSSGTMGDESSFHRALPGLVWRHLRRRSIGHAAVQLAILTLWQVVNVIGYLDGRRGIRDR